ncbi:M48 family metalloprotease [Desulfobacterales bacterium HSG17]|nr:M48 family metalloprotease [Desulfobacterales bacterium HSG17]
MSAAGFALGCAVNPVTGENQLMLMSEQQEVQVDQQYAPHQFSSDYGVSQDGRLNNYVSQVGKKLVPLTHRKQMPYSFQVVNATYVNAYAFPGGTIAATRGILLKLNNEAELSALMGHELGHVNARHTASQMSKSQLTSGLLAGIQLVVSAKYAKYSDLAGQLGMMGAGLLLAKYSRNNERQADDLGNQYMVQAGYSTKGHVGLMSMLKSLSKSKPGYAEVLFSTHPMSDERYNTAVENSRTKYQATQNFPVNREKYMDSIASLRKIKEPIENIQKGESAMAQNKLSDAQTYFQKALKKAPRDYVGLLMMSKCQIAQKKYSQAESYAVKAKRAYPREPQAYHMSGFAKLKNKKYNAAFNEFDACDKALPGNPSLTFFKGYSKEGMQSKKDAANYYNKYLQAVNQGDYAKHAYDSLVKWGYVKKQ